MALEPITGAIDLAKVLVERFWPKAASEAEKAEAVLGTEKLISQRDDVVISAQKEIIVAEMSQGDAYTKRARPTIVYFGLAAIGIVHVLFPIIAWIALVVKSKPLEIMPNIQLPAEFWYVWGGVCSIWIIGRTMERKGISGKLVEIINGKK